MVEKYLGEVNSYFKCLLQKKSCLSVYLPDFFESADARDLGLMTLFFLFKPFNNYTIFAGLQTICLIRGHALKAGAL